MDETIPAYNCEASTRTDDGGPAFPRSDDVANSNAGMSPRDWFAGQALAGLCAYNESAEPRIYAITSYALADAMLAARGAK